MAAINQIEFRSPLAACQSVDKHIRVFFVDNAGGIRETYSEAPNYLTWYGGVSPITTDKIGTPLSAPLNGDDGVVFFISQDKNLKMLYLVGADWVLHPGVNIPVASYSQIASCYLLPFYGNQYRPRVYVQLADDTIQEYGLDTSSVGAYGTAPALIPAANLGAALPGTAIAATCYSNAGEECIRIYYQSPTLTLTEKIHQGPWTQSPTPFPLAVPLPPRGALTLVPFHDNPSSLTTPQLRLYYISADNQIHEQCNDVGTWFAGGFEKPCIPGSGLAMVAWLDKSMSKIRLYFQGGVKVTGVSEICWDLPRGWYDRVGALPPA